MRNFKWWPADKPTPIPPKVAPALPKKSYDPFDGLPLNTISIAQYWMPREMDVDSFVDAAWERNRLDGKY